MAAPRRDAGYLEGDDEDDDDIEAHKHDEFDRKYMDERSWEALAEDEHGRLIAAAQQAGGRKRARPAEGAARIRRGLMRYLQLVLDLSETCAASNDMAPNRAVVLVSLATKFITEFFDQNPLSQLCVIAMRHGRAIALSDFSASPAQQKKVLSGAIETGGVVSLQNTLSLLAQNAQGIPPYGSKEAVVLLSSLTTCDPGAIGDAIKAVKAAHVRVHIIGLSAEMFVSGKIAQETGATCRVALSEAHLAELVQQLCTPPAVAAEQAVPNLVRMGFPSKDPDGVVNATFVGAAADVAGGAFTCPVCLAKNVSIPCDCHVCNVTLISAPHLARSYHHLFPVPAFTEVDLAELDARQACAFCRMPIRLRRDNVLAVPDSAARCGRCQSVCCGDCEEFVHEHLHNCPGCEAGPARA